jgi:hypothetical protein
VSPRRHLLQLRWLLHGALLLLPGALLAQAHPVSLTQVSPPALSQVRWLCRK